MSEKEAGDGAHKKYKITIQVFKCLVEFKACKLYFTWLCLKPVLASSNLWRAGGRAGD